MENICGLFQEKGTEKSVTWHSGKSTLLKYTAYSKAAVLTKKVVGIKLGNWRDTLGLRCFPDVTKTDAMHSLESIPTMGVTFQRSDYVSWKMFTCQAHSIKEMRYITEKFSVTRINFKILLATKE